VEVFVIFLEHRLSRMEENRTAQHDGANDAPTKGATSWTIGLAPTGDKGSAFHTKNDPSKPLQRTNYVERPGAVEVRCSCIDVIHGLIAADSDVFATLMVLEFRFDSRRRARRISSVDIEFRFSGLGASAEQPEVGAISPCGHFDIAPTTQSESSTFSVNFGVSATPAPVPTLNAGVNYERGVARDMTYAATVTGATALRGRNFGSPNCASWTLLENPATKKGVPVAMRAAILLNRQDEEQFQCVVTINAKADWRSQLETVFGSTPPDDPVLFDPALEPTNTAYDEMNLGKVDLEALSTITFGKVVGGTSETALDTKT
jgi:hypothetical protein